MNTDSMNFLSIDCSTATGSLFVKTKNKTFNKVLQSDKFGNDLLVKQILDFLMENNINFDNLSQIFVNQGPGNFSGLRSSLAAAKGIVLSKNLKLFGYNTFTWSCTKFFNKIDLICSLIKFREKYFIKKFDKHLNGVSEIKEITKYEIIKKYNTEFLVIPKNIAQYCDEKILGLDNLNIVSLDHNELEFLQLKGLLNNNLVGPLYLN